MTNSNFSNQVKDMVKKIAKGKTMTYKQVADAIGRPKAARAVAKVLATNYDPKIPCHRVIRTDGNIGGYNRGGEKKKRAILKSEGINI